MPTVITPQLIEALQTGFQRVYQAAYDDATAASFYEDVATTVPSSTASETYGWLGDFPDLREWIGDRVVNSMKASSYQIVNKQYESTVGVHSTKIKDDQVGIYRPMFASMGESAGRHPDKMVSALLKNAAATLCYDGQNYFDTDHPVYPNVDGTGVAETISNYDDGGATPGPAWYLMDTNRPLKPLIFQEREKPSFQAQVDPKTSEATWRRSVYEYGVESRCNVGFGFWQMAYCSKSELNSDSLDAAIQAMMEFKADGGRPLGITPNLLLVPPALRSKANKTVKVMLGDGGASNPNYEAVDVKVVPWLA